MNLITYQFTPLPCLVVSFLNWLWIFAPNFFICRGLYNAYPFNLGHLWLCNHWTRSCTDLLWKRKRTRQYMQVWFHGQAYDSTFWDNGLVSDVRHWFGHCHVRQPYNVLWDKTSWRKTSLFGSKWNPFKSSWSRSINVHLIFNQRHFVYTWIVNTPHLFLFLTGLIDIWFIDFRLNSIQNIQWYIVSLIEKFNYPTPPYFMLCHKECRF